MDNLQFKVLELLETKGELLPSEIWRDPEIAIDMAVSNKGVLEILGALVKTNQIGYSNSKYHILESGSISYLKELKIRSKKKEPHWMVKALVGTLIASLFAIIVYLITHSQWLNQMLHIQSQETIDTSNQLLRDSIRLK